MQQVSIRIKIDRGTVLLSPIPRKDGHFLVDYERHSTEYDRDGVSRFLCDIARPCVWLRMFRRALEESGLPEWQKDLFREIIASVTSSPAPQPKEMRTRK